jgi:hypothetical protein
LGFDSGAFGVFIETVEGLAGNAVARRIGIARQSFRAAIRRKLLVENPLTGLEPWVLDGR